jgi:UDP-N-acetylglucosamine 1-carboxyvinyltransferase
MSRIEIQGAESPIDVRYEDYRQGSKNAALPTLCAALLFNKEILLSGVPDIEDVKVILDIFRAINLRFAYCNGDFIRYRSAIRYARLKENFYTLRGGFYLVAALILRWKEVEIEGYRLSGCRIGERRYDKFFEVLAAFGCDIQLGQNLLIKKNIRRRKYVIELNDLGIVATGMALILASQCSHRTVLISPSKAPEINDLITFLQRNGVLVERTAGKLVVSKGKKDDREVRFKIQDDRIVVASQMLLALATNGTFTVQTDKLKYLTSLMQFLEKLGFIISPRQKSTSISGGTRLIPGHVEIDDYPSIPTDIQPLLVVLLCTIEGRSTVKDKIFPTRISHADQLRRLNQNVYCENGSIVVNGRREFKGSILESNDMRCSAALLLASCLARGSTVINGYSDVYRGYTNLLEIIKRHRVVIEGHEE